MSKLTIALLAGVAVLLGACNTIAGMGRDVSSVGRTVEKAAN